MPNFWECKVENRLRITVDENRVTLSANSGKSVYAFHCAPHDPRVIAIGIKHVLKVLVPDTDITFNVPHTPGDPSEAFRVTLESSTDEHNRTR